MRPALRQTSVLVAAALISIASAVPHASAEASTTTSATSTAGGPYTACLLEVPYNVTIGGYHNSYGYGVSALFPNGTEILFPYTNCMRPVHPDMYQVILGIGNNPDFIAAENGTLYSWGGFPSYEELVNNTYNGLPSAVCHSGSVTTPIGTECYAGNYLWFFHYNGRVLKGCGGAPFQDFDGWIDVHVAINFTDGIDTAYIKVKQLGGFDAEAGFLCTTTASVSSTSAITHSPSQGGTALASAATRTITVTLHSASSLAVAVVASLVVLAGVAFLVTVARLRARPGTGSSPLTARTR